MKLPNIMEGKFKHQGQIDQGLEEWLCPRVSEPDCSYFSE